jgi:hypothetical protein
LTSTFEIGLVAESVWLVLDVEIGEEDAPPAAIAVFESGTTSRVNAKDWAAALPEFTAMIAKVGRASLMTYGQVGNAYRAQTTSAAGEHWKCQKGMGLSFISISASERQVYNGLWATVAAVLV